MRVLGMSVLAIAVFVSEAVSVGADAKKDQEKIQGTWEAVEFVLNGKSIPDEERQKIRLAFNGERLDLTADGVEEKREFTFKLDGSKKPKIIETTPLGGLYKGKRSLGIYEFDGESLRLCMYNDDSKNAPPEFKSPDGANLVLMVLKRVKAK
jgi:uncharacterized protein (TIGR03067 family)